MNCLQSQEIKKIIKKLFKNPVVPSVLTITTRINKIKSLCGANVYHVPSLCLLGIGGAPYINQTISYFQLLF